MDKSLYFDLWIEDGDLLLKSDNEPQLCNNRLAIAQDLKHQILESSLITQMIGERNAILRQDLRLQIVLLVEEDPRVIPGTVQILEKNERLSISADSVDFGSLPSMEIYINGGF